jgi:hypothetical protein
LTDWKVVSYGGAARNGTTIGREPMNDITPQQAREQLAEAEAATDRRAGDRRVHALATAGFGLLVGAYLAVSRLAEGTAWQTSATTFYVLLLFALAAWQTRGASTWPRHARLTSWVGLGVTMLLLLAAMMAFNVREAQQEADGLVPTENVALLALAGLVVAAPMLVAAVRIDRGERR